MACATRRKRRWSAEENRHGDVLNRYLYLCGRLDMRQVERTIQRLIGSGMRTIPVYRGFVFQERATLVSHGNMARHGREHGDLTLARICGLIAADERQHEDRGEAVRARPRRRRARAGGHDEEAHHDAGAPDVRRPRPPPLPPLLCGGAAPRRVHGPGLRGHRRLLRQDVGGGGCRAGLVRAQDYVCGLPQRIRRMEERAPETTARPQDSRLLIPFSWIFNREVLL
ncbi:Stearoyl-(acyl-carrier-protein) 9-desaturase, chloroplastic [Ananas comosus]|uniref:Stearoyl-(Acyl-carrier-protein) 9-desaturase, chloroplastic n=1 Tax=Ananas comosus TaxID=4615 RepID=A0A199V900_ANACO|nr:Stearoyl-(acyl-carrier-protein) 9-desaturase, chloroplastic [Ananas comosus]